MMIHLECHPADYHKIMKCINNDLKALLTINLSTNLSVQRHHVWTVWSESLYGSTGIRLTTGSVPIEYYIEGYHA